MDFKELVNKLSHPVLVTDSKLELRFLNLNAQTALQMPDPLWHSRKLTDFLIIRQQDKKNLELAMEDGLGINIPVFLKSNKKGTDILEKKMTCNSFGYETTGVRHYFFEIEDRIEPTVSIETVQNLGQMTGSLAHSISNPLAIIQINCDTLEIECQKSQSLKSEKVHSKVSKIGTALDRVCAETESLKDLSRKMTSADELNIIKVSIPANAKEQDH